MGSMKTYAAEASVFGAILVVLFGCAQISSPTGGPVDEDPPQVVTMTPPTDEVNVHPASLRILFDEFVALKNPQQQLIISPPIATQPLLKIKGKEVRVEMDPQAFQDSTTYVFSFGGGVVDLHESNPALDLNWAFSTGSSMDSLALSGRIVDRMSGDPREGLRILLYQEPVDIDSILAGNLPNAIGASNKDGVFRIDYLGKGEFFALAIDDANANYQWDKGEYLAFDTISMVAGDTLQKPFLGFEPKEVEALHYIESSKVDSMGSIRVYAPLDEDKFQEDWSAMLAGVSVESPWERSGDSVFLWVDTGIIGDYQNVELAWSGESFSDTAKVRLDRMPRRQFPKILEKLPRTSSAQGTRSLSFDRAVIIADSTQWMLIQGMDTLTGTEFALSATQEQSFGRTLQMAFKEKDGSDYQLIAFPGALRNPKGQVQGDTLEWRWKTHPEDHFGELNVELSRLPGKGWFLIGLGKGITQRIRCNADTILNFPRLVPGAYKIGYEWDVNGDSTWQVGDVSLLEVPEPYFYPQENPSIRSNWLVEWLWDFSVGESDE